MHTLPLATEQDSADFVVGYDSVDVTESANGTAKRYPLYQLSLGNATTPALNFGLATGDTNTGIYSAGADTLGISTGGSLREYITTASIRNYTGAYIMDWKSTMSVSPASTGKWYFDSDDGEMYTSVNGAAFERVVTADASGYANIDRIISSADADNFLHLTGSTMYVTNGFGSPVLSATNSGAVVSSGYGYHFGQTSATSSIVSSIYSDAFDSVSIRNGTDPSELRVYNTTTGPEYLSINWTTTANTATIETLANRSIAITPHGTGSLLLDGLTWPAADGTSGQVIQTNGAGTLSFVDAGGGVESDTWIIPVTDQVTDLTAGTNKFEFQVPYAATITNTWASVKTAAVGQDIIVDINEGGISIFSVPMHIDPSEKHSKDAITQPTRTDSTLAQWGVLTIDLDQTGTTTAGQGLVIYVEHTH